VTVKVASTLDGRIATRVGESRWITGETARAHAHLLRAQNDAVMVGVGTAITDDPELGCRLPGLTERSPVRIVVDSRLRLPLTSKLAAGARERPTWIVTVDSPPPERARAFRDLGIELIAVEAAPGGYPDMAKALGEMGQRGLTRVMVEGGSMLTAALLRARLVDRLVWFHAPALIGGDGVPAAAALGLDRLAQAPRFERTDVVPVGPDLMELYRAAT
jgi:diaminohydroxyphosphoribosylaminopyrimidine deaminase/5-amino-6-(5-phosphoribosylamino)uracil reductase